jgi:DEAD/DEAH box helicase domain-containing protein
VHSPRCGNGNRPIDKAGAARVIDFLLGRAALPAHPAPPPSLRLPETAIPVRREADAVPRAPRRVLVLDLETQRSAEEVGGWHNAHLMRVAVAVVHDSLEDRFECYTEKEIHDLLHRLRAGDLVVGYNLLRFDYAVLRGYTDEDLSALPTFDLLADLTRSSAGFAGHLREQTLGQRGPPTTRIAAVVEIGRGVRVMEYCRQDVDITRRLFEHGAGAARCSGRAAASACAFRGWDVRGIRRASGQARGPAAPPSRRAPEARP